MHDLRLAQKLAQTGGCNCRQQTVHSSRCCAPLGALKFLEPVVVLGLVGSPQQVPAFRDRTNQTPETKTRPASGGKLNENYIDIVEKKAVPVPLETCADRVASIGRFTASPGTARRRESTTQAGRGRPAVCSRRRPPASSPQPLPAVCRSGRSVSTAAAGRRRRCTRP